jgi:rsbT co-antagonist protein RsbR
VRFLGGTTPDDVMGKTVFELYPQELAAQYYADDQKVIRSDQPLLKREERSVDQAGNRVWHLTTKVPLRDSEGEIVGLVGIARDITERKRADEALRRERQQQEIIETQRQALRELSTPIVPVLEGVLVLPLVGGIDTRRAQQVMETLLEAIGRYQAEVVIIDITGVPVVDTGVANHLLQVTRAAALLGSECVLVGISPEVAQTIVSLGVDLSSVVTQANLQSGIEHALKKTGRRIVNG